jgi:hypothetical protein
VRALPEETTRCRESIARSYRKWLELRRKWLVIDCRTRSDAQTGAAQHHLSPMRAERQASIESGMITRARGENEHAVGARPQDWRIRLGCSVLANWSVATVAAFPLRAPSPKYLNVRPADATRADSALRGCLLASFGPHEVEHLDHLVYRSRGRVELLLQLWKLALATSFSTGLGLEQRGQPAPARRTRLRMTEGLMRAPACLRQPYDPPWSPSGRLWGSGVPSTRSQIWALRSAFEHA